MLLSVSPLPHLDSDRIQMAVVSVWKASSNVSWLRWCCKSWVVVINNKFLKADRLFFQAQPLSGTHAFQQNERGRITTLDAAQICLFVSPL